MLEARNNHSFIYLASSFYISLFYALCYDYLDV